MLLGGFADFQEGAPIVSLLAD